MSIEFQIQKIKDYNWSIPNSGIYQISIQNIPLEGITLEVSNGRILPLDANGRSFWYVVPLTSPAESFVFVRQNGVLLLTHPLGVIVGSPYLYFVPRRSVARVSEPFVIDVFISDIYGSVEGEILQPSVGTITPFVGESNHSQAVWTIVPETVGNNTYQIKYNGSQNNRMTTATTNVLTELKLSPSLNLEVSSIPDVIYELVIFIDITNYENSVIGQTPEVSEGLTSPFVSIPGEFKGRSIWRITPTEAGIFSYSATYTGNYDNASVSSNITVTINKVQPELLVNPDTFDVIVGESHLFNVYITNYYDLPNSYLHFNNSSFSIQQDAEDGYFATIVHDATTLGLNQEADITFDENINNLNAVKTVVFNVSRALPVLQILYPNQPYSSMYVGDSLDIIFEVVNYVGEDLTVSVSLGTNILLQNGKGLYTFTPTYTNPEEAIIFYAVENDSNENSDAVSIFVNIMKRTPSMILSTETPVIIIGEQIQIDVFFEGYYGSSEDVSFVVGTNPPFYLNTLNEGFWRFTPLFTGTFIFNVAYAGDSNNNPVNENINIIVQKRDVSIESGIINTIVRLRDSLVVDLTITDFYFDSNSAIVMSNFFENTQFDSNATIRISKIINTFGLNTIDFVLAEDGYNNRSEVQIIVDVKKFIPAFYFEYDYYHLIGDEYQIEVGFDDLFDTLSGQTIILKEPFQQIITNINGNGVFTLTANEIGVSNFTFSFEGNQYNEAIEHTISIEIIKRTPTLLIYPKHLNNVNYVDNPVTLCAEIVGYYNDSDDNFIAVGDSVYRLENDKTEWVVIPFEVGELTIVGRYVGNFTNNSVEQELTLEIAPKPIPELIVNTRLVDRTTFVIELQFSNILSDSNRHVVYLDNQMLFLNSEGFTSCVYEASNTGENEFVVLIPESALNQEKTFIESVIVFPAQPIIEVSPLFVNCVIGQSVPINIRVIDSSGNIPVVFPDNTTAEIGQNDYVWQFTPEEYGEIQLQFISAGNEDNLECLTSLSTTVEKETPQLQVSLSNNEYVIGQTINISVIIVRAYSNSHTIIFDDTNYFFEGSETIIEYTPTQTGNLFLVIDYVENLFNQSASTEFTINIVKASPTLVVLPSSSTFSSLLSSADLSIQISGFYGDNPRYVSVNNDMLELATNQETYNYVFPNVGTHVLNFTLVEDEFNSSSYRISEILVNKASPTLQLSSLPSIRVGEEIQVTCQISNLSSFTSLTSENVLFVVEDQSSSVPFSEDGVSIFNYIPNKSGTLIIYAIFESDTYNNETRTQRTISVIKASPTLEVDYKTPTVAKLPIGIVTTITNGFEIGLQNILYLPDNANVSIIPNDDNNAGTATYLFKPSSSGTYTMTIRYPGDNNNNTVEETISITVLEEEMQTLRYTIKLNLDFNSIVDTREFINSFRKDIATSLQLSVTQVGVVSISPGSVIVNFILSAPITEQLDLYNLLLQQINDPGSILLSGIYTYSIDTSFTVTTQPVTITDTWNSQPIFNNGDLVPSVFIDTIPVYYDSGSGTLLWESSSNTPVYIALDGTMTVTFSYINNGGVGTVSQVSSYLNDADIEDKLSISSNTHGIGTVTFSNDGFARFALSGEGSSITFQVPVPACFDGDTILCTRFKGNKKIKDLIPDDWIQGERNDLWLRVINVGKIVVRKSDYNVRISMYNVKINDTVIRITQNHMILFKTEKEVLQYVDNKLTNRDFLKDRVMGKYLYLFPYEIKDIYSSIVPWPRKRKYMELYHVIVEPVDNYDPIHKRMAICVNENILSESCSHIGFELMYPLFFDENRLKRPANLHKNVHIISSI